METELSRRTTIDHLPAHYSQPAYVERVREELRGMFENGTTQLKKRYLRTILEDVTVTGNDIEVRPKGEGIIGTLECLDEVGRVERTEVINRSNKWQPVCYTVYNFSYSLQIEYKAFQRKRLRFNPIQIAEWLAELRRRKGLGTQQALASELGVSRTRVIQYLNLMRIPEKYRTRLKSVDTLTEYQLRPIVALPPNRQSRAIRAILARTS